MCLLPVHRKAPRGLIAPSSWHIHFMHLSCSSAAVPRPHTHQARSTRYVLLIPTIPQCCGQACKGRLAKAVRACNRRDNGRGLIFGKEGRLSSIYCPTCPEAGAVATVPQHTCISVASSSILRIPVPQVLRFLPAVGEIRSQPPQLGGTA